MAIVQRMIAAILSSMRRHWMVFLVLLVTVVQWGNSTTNLPTSEHSCLLRHLCLKRESLCCENHLSLLATCNSEVMTICQDRNMYTYINTRYVYVPSVLWRCWLGSRKGIRPVKNWVLGCRTWLPVWSEVQTCIWPSWCHCHSLSLASVKSRLFLPFWYQLTCVVPERAIKWVCVYVCVCILLFFYYCGFYWFLDVTLH